MSTNHACHATFIRQQIILQWIASIRINYHSEEGIFSSNNCVFGTRMNEMFDPDVVQVMISLELNLMTAKLNAKSVALSFALFFQF